jgi:hypothetical protein
MAAGDFTASALQVGQIRLGEMFATPNIAQTELLKGSASTARALLAKNKSRTVPRLVGDKCVGVEAYFLRPHAESGIDFATPTTCTTPCGDESETVKGTYDTVVLAEAQGKVLDNRCDNLVNFGEELAIVQAHMMSQMRFEFNTVVAIPTLVSRNASEPRHFHGCHVGWHDQHAAHHHSRSRLFLRAFP